jgi:release factor glutamine methyltransferase
MHRDDARIYREQPRALERGHRDFIMTVLELLQRTTDFFQKHGVESPRLNAEHLLAFVLKQKRIELYLEFERVLTEEELAPLRDLVRRRGQGEPLQHLLGTVEFAGHTFLSDKRALVPRPETEQLVERIADCRLPNADCHILDVGTGSGVIALSLAAKFPQAEVIATDLSDEALNLARENAERLGVRNVVFSKADLLEGVTGSFDLIVANLPYVSSTDRGALSREVLRDPDTALFGGERGDEIVRKLIEAAPSHLAPGGLLALELGAGQADDLAAFMAKKNYHDIKTERDFAGVIRFLFGRYG